MVDKEIVTLLSSEKSLKSWVHCNLAGTGGHAKWNESERKRQIPDDLSQMWSIMKLCGNR